MIEVREVVTDKDYQDYLAIRRAVFIEEQQVPREEEIDEYEETSTHYIAFYEGEPAGTGRIRLNKGFVKFERIATLEKFRGKGIASAIIEMMEKRSHMKYSEYLPAMHAQVSAVSFYLKRGWVEVGEVFDESGIEHQVMVLLPKKLDHLKCLKDPETPPVVRDFLKARISKGND